MAAATGGMGTDEFPIATVLLDDELRPQSVFASMTEGVCVIEVRFDAAGAPTDYRFLDANPAFEAHTGYTDVVGKRLLELQPDAEARWLEPFGRVAMTGTPERFVCPVQAVGNRWHEVHAFRVGAPDERKVAAFYFDITERQQVEEALRNERNFIDQVLNTVGALVVVVDPAGRIIRFNRECETVTGYSAEEAIGQNVFDLFIPEEDRRGVERTILHHQEGRDQTIHENHWVTKRGDRRLIRWSSTVLRGANGAVKNVIGTGIDITVRRRLEKQVVAMSETERRRIGQDLHDLLASELAGISMMAHALVRRAERGETVTADAIQDVASLIHEAGHQARMMSHSLMPLDVKGDGLAGALTKLVNRQQGMLPDITFTLDVDAAVPSLSSDDASHLYRIVCEAITNAAKHAGARAIHVRLSVRDDALDLEVRDDGVGIHAANDASEGLGIHMMQYRAELIGCQFDIVSPESGGTLVRCLLPLKRDAAPGSHEGRTL